MTLNRQFESVPLFKRFQKKKSRFEIFEIVLRMTENARKLRFDVTAVTLHVSLFSTQKKGLRAWTLGNT